MTALDSLPPLRDVIRQHGLSARKSLGQNFILDLNLTRRIARLAGPLEGVTAVEVGPGPGGLTRALLMEGAARVIVIERDRRCLPALKDIAAHYPSRLKIVEGDALEADYARLAQATPCRLVANLPYSIATALLAGWLEADPWPPWWDRAVLMFQREVAERIVAAPGGKAYGRLAVLAQWRTIPRIRMSLPPRAFTPAPKVESAVIEFEPRVAPATHCTPAAIARVTAAAFGQRRKMLRTSLRTLHANAEEVLTRLGIDPALRAEDLTVEQFCLLAEALGR